MTLRTLRLSASAALFAAFVSLSGLQPRACAQAQATASKTYSLDVFGDVAFLNPKYGTTTGEIGYVVGGDVTRHFRLLDVSFEARYTDATGVSADESTFGGGVKLERAFRRFHPYVDFLVESGKIKFDHPSIFDPTYTHDDSFVYDIGGGFDYDLVGNFAFKADIQGQRWVIGAERQPFNPYNVSAGVMYRIPFRALHRRR